MSKIIASVSNIQSCDSLHLVKFDFNGFVLTMISLELDSNIKLNTKVILSVKPTNIAITKDATTKTSHANQLKVKIIQIANGKLLSNIRLELFDGVTIESIITKESAQRLNLKDGEKVTALIKASDIFIYEILNA